MALVNKVEAMDNARALSLKGLLNAGFMVNPLVNELVFLVSKKTGDIRTQK